MRTLVQIRASLVFCRGQSDGGENCIVLKIGPTRSVIAKLPQSSMLAVCEFRTASEDGASKATDGCV